MRLDDLDPGRLGPVDDLDAFLPGRDGLAHLGDLLMRLPGKPVPQPG